MGQQMILDDCCTREFAISLLCFTALVYGDLIPTSEELRRILRFAKKGGETHLFSCI